MKRGDKHHTYRFLKRRKNELRWRRQYLRARNQRLLRVLVSVPLALGVLLLVFSLVGNGMSARSQKYAVADLKTTTTTTSTERSSSAEVVEALAVAEAPQTVTEPAELAQTGQAEAVSEPVIDAAAERAQQVAAYETSIREAVIRQQEYIESIEDPNLQSNVQSTIGAAYTEATYLMITYPEDQELILEAVSNVVNVNY